MSRKRNQSRSWRAPVENRCPKDGITPEVDSRFPTTGGKPPVGNVAQENPLAELGQQVIREALQRSIREFEQRHRNTHRDRRGGENG